MITRLAPWRGQPCQRVLDVGEHLVHRLLAVHDDLDPGELVAIDHLLRQLVVEPEPVADRLG
jgi:hypothetical protein